MNNVFSIVLPGALLIVALVASGQVEVAGWEGEIWIHPEAEKLPTDQQGPFVGLGDGRVMGVSSNNVVISTDDGATWQRSNLLDSLCGGGPGDHSGLIEATVVQLKDGRIWMLIRTYSGYFWQAYSSDEGLTWSEPESSTIEASGSPGTLLRLNSGRIMLVWNRFGVGYRLEAP